MKRLPAAIQYLKDTYIPAGNERRERKTRTTRYCNVWYQLMPAGPSASLNVSSQGVPIHPSTSGIVNWSITRRVESVEIGRFPCQVKISAASHGTQLGGVAVRIWGAEL